MYHFRLFALIERGAKTIFRKKVAGKREKISFAVFFLTPYQSGGLLVMLSIPFIISVETSVFPDYHTTRYSILSCKEPISLFLKRKIHSGNTEVSTEEVYGKDCLFVSQSPLPCFLYKLEQRWKCKYILVFRKLTWTVNLKT